MAVVGWILLGILGLLLLILLLVLFLPAAYRLEAKKTMEDLSVKARVSWLFGFFRLVFLYPEPGEPQIRIAFFTLKQKSKPNKKKTEKKADDKSDKKSGKNSTPSKSSDVAPAAGQVMKENSEEKPGTTAEYSGESPPKEGSGQEKPQGSGQESGSSGETAGKTDSSKPEETQEGKAAAKLKPKELYRKIRTEAEFFQKLWKQETTKSLVSELLARLLKILQSVFPRKIEGRLVFGADSPDITGYVLAIYSIARVKFPRRLSVEFTPDFEKQVLEGEVLVRGHVMLATLVWNGLRVLLDKRLKKLWRQVERHIS